MDVSVADSMPGIARARSITRRYTARARGSSYPARPGSRLASRTRSCRNPGSRRLPASRRARTARPRRAARATARSDRRPGRSSRRTSGGRLSRERSAVPAAPGAFRSVTTSVRDSFSAGPRPNASVLATAKAMVAASTFTSGFGSNSSASGSSGVSVETIRVMAQNEKTNPTKAPASASVRLSVSSCLTMRAGRPPSARRTAISRRRAAPRASIMLAMFRHAISSTIADMPISSAAATRARLGLRLRARRDARQRGDRQRLILVLGGIGSRRVDGRACRARPPPSPARRRPSAALPRSARGSRDRPAPSPCS